MIKVGIICEGKSDQTIFSSELFKSYLISIGIDLLDDVVDAKGSGNLLPHNIQEYITRLQVKGAEKILIVRDKDTFPCFSSVKQHIGARPEDIVVVPQKELESWFLANTNAMCILLGDDNFFFENPENEIEPFETINQLLVKYKGRGVGKKTAAKQNLVEKLISCNIQLQNSANHPNCPSAKYFIDKLKQIATSQQ